MGQTEMSGQSANQLAEGPTIPLNASSPVTQMGMTLSSQTGEGTSLPDGDGSGVLPPGAAMATYSYVYALGRLEPRFPRLAVEKICQATGQA
jgi:hypothetical protein